MESLVKKRDGMSRKTIKKALAVVRAGGYKSKTLYDIKALIETARVCVEEQAEKFSAGDRGNLLSFLESAKVYVDKASKERRAEWDEIISEAKAKKPAPTPEELVKRQNREAARARLKVKIFSASKPGKTYSVLPDYNGGL
jgi:hypothetical protein